VATSHSAQLRSRLSHWSNPMAVKTKTLENGLDNKLPWRSGFALKLEAPAIGNTISESRSLR